jgi:hypothetical protein
MAAPTPSRTTPPNPPPARRVRLAELLIGLVALGWDDRSPDSPSHKIDKDGRRTTPSAPSSYQDPQQEAERLKAVHEARVKIVPRV